MKESYQTLLARCIAKGIVLTNETEPVCIPFKKIATQNKIATQKNKIQDEFIAAKNNLLGEFHKWEGQIAGIKN